MQYRKLGNTDIDISVIGLGTMTFGQQNNEGEAHRQLDFAIEQGVNFIDCAEMYPVPPKAKTQGRTEEYIGSWMKQRGNRDNVILATKVTGPSGPALKYIRRGPRLNRQHLEIALKSSLSRLQTDYIDLYQVHWPERHTNFFGKLGYVPENDDDAIPIIETLEVLNEFVEKGLIRHIGVSNETPWGLMEYLRLTIRHDFARIVSIQNPYNLLNRSYDIGLAEMSYREQIGLLAYSPLSFGVLSGKYIDGSAAISSRLNVWGHIYGRYTNPAAVNATKRYVQLARDHYLSPAQMALAYVNSRPFLTSNIIGATTMKQLEENIHSINISLGDDVLEGIETIHAEISNPAP